MYFRLKASRILVVVFSLTLALLSLAACGTKESDDNNSDTKAPGNNIEAENDEAENGTGNDEDENDGAENDGTENDGAENDGTENDGAENDGADNANVGSGDEGGNKMKVEIEVEDFGKIVVELDDTVAPISVANFLDLVEREYYDGLTFHRIIKGFMIQGGQGNDKSTQLTPIKGEFQKNGVDNPMKHTRGTISMARTGDPNSATSQFFICDADSSHLDGDYAAFGKVIDGIDVVDKIADTPVVDGNGKVMSEDQPVIKSIRIVS